MSFRFVLIAAVMVFCRLQGISVYESCELYCFYLPYENLIHASHLKFRQPDFAIVSFV